MNNIRLTDRLGLVGVDGTDYDDEQAEHITTVDADLLLQAAEILDTLGWEEIDITTVGQSGDREGNPMVILRPPTESLFTGEQAGIGITPRTEKGRTKSIKEESE